MTNRYVAQAESDYTGTPVGIAHYIDEYGEYHVLLKMQDGRQHYYLDWIGGEYADEPDEMGEDEPFEGKLIWQSVPSY